MNKHQISKTSPCKRVGIFIWMIVFIVTQASGAYASHCLVVHKVDTEPSIQISSNEQQADPVKKAMHSNMPPCHQHTMNGESSKLQDKAEAIGESWNCCGEHCTCVKGGNSSLAIVAPQPNANFFPVPNPSLTLVKEGITSTLIQNPFRPPICISLG